MIISIFKIEIQLKKYIFSIILVTASYFQDGELFSSYKLYLAPRIVIRRGVIFKLQVIPNTSNRFKTGSYF